MHASKLQYLFENLQGLKYPNNKYLTYVTPAAISKIIIAEANMQFNLSDKIVWDMFAGIGCDSVRFAEISGRVKCTELDVDTYRCLEQNTIGDNNNIEIYNQDCCEEDLSCDIVYFDPPWGDTFKSGENFTFDDVMLLNGTKIVDLLLRIQRNHGVIVKSPYKCDTFDNLFNSDDIIRIITFSKQKLKYLIVKSRNDEL